MAVWIPPGVVHAYRNVGTIPGLVFNSPNRLYAGYGKREPVDEIRRRGCRTRTIPDGLIVARPSIKVLAEAAAGWTPGPPILVRHRRIRPPLADRIVNW